MRERRSPKYFLGNAVPPNDISGQGESVPPNRLAKKCKVYGKSQQFFYESEMPISFIEGVSSRPIVFGLTQ